MAVAVLGGQGAVWMEQRQGGQDEEETRTVS